METTGQKITINVLYIGLIITTVLGFAPSIPMQIIAAVLLIVVVGAAKIYKARDSEGGLMHNHMTYLIRTVTLGTALLIVSVVLAGLFFASSADNSGLAAMVSGNGGALPDNLDVNSMISQYAGANEGLIHSSELISSAPAILYFVYRIGNGYGRAMKGYRIANPKSWL